MIPIVALLVWLVDRSSTGHLVAVGQTLGDLLHQGVTLIRLQLVGQGNQHLPCNSRVFPLFGSLGGVPELG